MQPRRIRQVNFGAGGRVVCAGSRSSSSNNSNNKKLRYAKFKFFVCANSKCENALFIINLSVFFLNANIFMQVFM